MALYKQRGGKPAVTTLVPILVNTKQGEVGKPASFRLRTKRPTLVREFTDADIKGVLRSLKEEDSARFYSLLELIKALQRNDSLALAHAIERLEKSLRRNSSENKMNVGPGSGKTWWLGFALTLRDMENKKQNSQWLLSRHLSEELREVKLVLWWTGKHFTPALYCLLESSALYVRALLGLGSATKTFMVCPHCGTAFIQDRTDQQYCSVAHREAHRVARWRARKRGTKISKRGIRKEE
jgi:hypothetical protein